MTDLTAKKIHRSFSDIDAMYLWQHPSALLRLAVKTQSEMTCEAFLSRGGSLEQKIQEALVGATFLSIFQRLVSPVMGRMARINEEALDIEARTANGTIYQLEVTTAYPPGYRIREAYRNGSKPEIPQSAFAGEPISAEWVATTILRKTAKVEKKRLNRHLLVYQNIFGGVPDLRRLRKLISGVESIWASVWLISGVPEWGGVALLCNTHGFNWSTKEWLSYVNAQEGKGFSGFDIYLQQGNESMRATREVKGQQMLGLRGEQLIDEIRRRVARGDFEFSQHAVDQAIIRHISVRELRQAIAGCLIFGMTSVGRPLHVQCSEPTRPLVKIITVYEPDPALWIEFKVRRT